MNINRSIGQHNLCICYVLFECVRVLCIGIFAATAVAVDAVVHVEDSWFLCDKAMGLFC